MKRSLATFVKIYYTIIITSKSGKYNCQTWCRHVLNDFVYDYIFVCFASLFAVLRSLSSLLHFCIIHCCGDFRDDTRVVYLTLLTEQRENLTY